MRYSIGIIGSGAMGKWHTYGCDRLNEFCYNDFMVHKAVICSRDSISLKEKNEKWGYDDCVTDWHKVVTRSDIDVIDISVPDHLHFPVAQAALENGKHIICEKPFVCTPEQGRLLCELANRKGLQGAVVTNYRYLAAFQAMKKLIINGKIGDIRHIYASFIMDWALSSDVGLFWRLDDSCCETGVLGDLGTHLIDTCRFLGMEFSEVEGMNETFTKQRKTGERMVDTHCDEICVFTARFQNNALGVFEASRVSGGRGRGGMVFEVHGTKGNVKWEMLNMNDLLVCNEEYNENGAYQRVSALDINDMVYPWGREFVQSDGFTLLFRDFFLGLHTGEKSYPTLEDGLKSVEVVDAVHRSCKKGIRIKL